MRRLVRALAGGSLLLGVLAACDSGGDSPAPTAATSAVTATSVAPSTTPPASPTPVGRATSCTDATGDGRGADLTSVTIDEGPEAVRVTWTVAGDDIAAIEGRGENVLFAVALTVTGTEDRLLLGVKELDGAFRTPIAYSVDFPDVTVTEPALVDGSTLTATYPPDVLTPLGSAWEFESSMDLRGDNIDNCPDLPGGS